MIRVLVVSHDSQLGGAERSLLDVLARLDRSEVEPILVVPRPGPLRAAAEALGVRVHERPVGHWIPYASRRGWRHLLRLLSTWSARVRGLARLIDEHRVDLVYTNTVTTVDGAVVAALTGRPHVWHVRERFADNPDLGSYLPAWVVGRVMCGLSRTVIVSSRALGRCFPTRPLGARVVTIHNGVDADAFASAGDVRETLAAEQGLPREALWVGMVGNLRPVKDPVTLLRAIGLLRDDGVDVACVVAGSDADGDYARRCRDLVRTLGLVDRVRFVGPRADVAALLRSLDVLALPSRTEGFSRVVLEAMAAGKPVVATRCGGPEDAVVDGETGFLVPVGDARRLADRLADLARDPERAARFGRTGAERVRASFRVEDCVARVQAVMRNAVVPLPERRARALSRRLVLSDS